MEYTPSVLSSRFSVAKGGGFRPAFRVEAWADQLRQCSPPHCLVVVVKLELRVELQRRLEPPPQERKIVIGIRLGCTRVLRREGGRQRNGRAVLNPEVLVEANRPNEQRPDNFLENGCVSRVDARLLHHLQRPQQIACHARRSDRAIHRAFRMR